MIKHDFSWGDTRGIRAIMVDIARPVLDLNQPWEKFGYPNHEGTEELLVEVRKLIRNLTGKDYKYVLITNGATNALSAYIYATKTEHTNVVYTHKLHFAFYPGIVKIHSLHHEKRDLVTPGLHDLAIIDSPSNPMGMVYGLADHGVHRKGVVWDAAYYSPTYCGIEVDGHLKIMGVVPDHDAMAGSLNKLTGINGLRVGWLATDRVEIYHKALDFIKYDSCGVSYISQHISTEILKKVDMEKFYLKSKQMLDNNREEMQKLHYIFRQEIPSMGMYAYYEVDDKIKGLLDRAGVKTMHGSEIGDTRDAIRFSLANSNAATKAMVKDILKADKK